MTDKIDQLKKFSSQLKVVGVSVIIKTNNFVFSSLSLLFCSFSALFSSDALLALVVVVVVVVGKSLK